MTGHRIERMTPERWGRVRAIRLRALGDSPDAFGMTLPEEEAKTASDWQARLADPAVATFVATRDGRDVGLVVTAPWAGRGSETGLFAMWVAPEARGTGLSDALVEAVVAHALASGATRILLDVADGNAPAIRLYERHGFVPTGEAGTLPPPRDHVREHQRARRVR